MFRMIPILRKTVPVSGIRQLSSVKFALFGQKHKNQDSIIERYYTQMHHWVDVLDRQDGKIRFGITDYGQDLLGDAIYVGVEQIDVGSVVRDTDLCNIETVKGLSDIKVPITGKVTEINNELHDMAAILTRDPEDQGWICEMEVEDLNQVTTLMTKEEYKKFTDRDLRKRELEKLESYPTN